MLSLTIALIASDMILFWWDSMTGNSPTIDAVRRRTDAGPGIFEETPTGLRMRRSLHDEPYQDAISHRRTSIRTNALGYRSGPILPKTPDEFRILVLGDSITAAPFVEESETYVALLEQELKKDGGNIRAINAGVSSLSLNDELNLLLETGLLTQPDIVLVGLYLNDATTTPTYPLPTGILAKSALLKRINRVRLANEAEARAEEQYERLSGRPFPTETHADGAWQTDRAAFDVEVARNADTWGGAWFQPSWDQMRVDLEALRELGKSNRFELMVALFPCTIQIEAEFVADEPQRFFERAMVDLDLPHLDFLPILRGEYQARKTSLMYDHSHPNVEGYRIIADKLAVFVREASVAYAARPRSPAPTDAAVRSK